MKRKLSAKVAIILSLAYLFSGASYAASNGSRSWTRDIACKARWARCKVAYPFDVLWNGVKFPLLGLFFGSADTDLENCETLVRQNVDGKCPYDRSFYEKDMSDRVVKSDRGKPGSKNNDARASSNKSAF